MRFLLSLAVNIREMANGLGLRVQWYAVRNVLYCNMESIQALVRSSKTMMLGLEGVLLRPPIDHEDNQQQEPGNQTDANISLALSSHSERPFLSLHASGANFRFLFLQSRASSFAGLCFLLHLTGRLSGGTQASFLFLLPFLLLPHLLAQYIQCLSFQHLLFFHGSRKVLGCSFVSQT